MPTFTKVCHTCEVQLHDKCIVFAKVANGDLPDPNLPGNGPQDLTGACFCWDAQHEIGLHPALTGHLAQRTLPVRGQMRDIEYETEPFYQVGPLDKGKGGKYGKPPTDEEDARTIRAEVDWRNETRRMYAEGDFPQF